MTDDLKIGDYDFEIRAEEYEGIPKTKKAALLLGCWYSRVDLL